MDKNKSFLRIVCNRTFLLIRMSYESSSPISYQIFPHMAEFYNYNVLIVTADIDGGLAPRAQQFDIIASLHKND